MKSYVDQTRVVTALMFVLLTLAISTFIERRALTENLLKVEKYYLAHLLINTPSASATKSDRETTDIAGNNSENYLDDLNAYENSSTVSEIKALAVFMRNAQWELFHRIPMKTGGWVYYKTVSNGFIPVENEDLSKKQCTTHREISDSVFQLKIHVQQHSAMLSRPFDIEFSDAFCEINHQSLGYRWKAREITAQFPQFESLGNRKDSRELRAEIFSIARRWTDTPGNIDDAYAKIRWRYDQDRVELPLIQSDVPSGLALSMLSAIAAAFSIYLSFLLRRIRNVGVEKISEWFVLDPLVNFPRVGFVARFLAGIELISFILFFTCAIMASVVIAILALRVETPSFQWLSFLSLTVACVMAISMLGHFFQILYQGIARRKQGSQA